MASYILLVPEAWLADRSPLPKSRRRAVTWLPEKGLQKEVSMLCAANRFRTDNKHLVKEY
jgi:hypothetical protein